MQVIYSISLKEKASKRPPQSPRPLQNDTLRPTGKHDLTKTFFFFRHS